MSEIPLPDFGKIQQIENMKQTMEISASDSNAKKKNQVDAHQENLSPGDKKSLQTYVKLVNKFNHSAEKLYGYCEHLFVDQLTQTAIELINKHLVEFKELLNRIESQQKVENDLQKRILPSPVSFSISAWKNDDNEEEDWPNPTSDNWVKLAMSQTNPAPPEITQSPKRDTPPLEVRLAKADKNKALMDNRRNREIRLKTNKIRRAHELWVQKQEQAITAIIEKQDSAAQRREAHINQRKKKARDESEKVNETRFIQELEAEGRKLKIEKKMNSVAQRYENLVREKREKAKERIAMKNPSSPSTDGKPETFDFIDLELKKLEINNNSSSSLVDSKQSKTSNSSSSSTSPSSPSTQIKKPFGSRNRNYTILEEIGMKQLPGAFLGTSDEFNEPIPAVILPDFPENDTQEIPNILKSLSLKMENGNLNSQIAISYLKTSGEYKININWNSTEGQLIRETVQNMIYSNAQNTNQIIHAIINLLNQQLSYSLALHIAFECLSSFGQLCYKRDSLDTTKELLIFWTTIINNQNHLEPTPLLISHLIKHGVIMKFCYVLEALAPDEVNNETLKQLALLIIQLLNSIFSYTMLHFNKLSTEVIELIGHSALDFVIPGICGVLITTMFYPQIHSADTIITIIRIFQSIIINFSPYITKLYNQEFINTITKVAISYFIATPQNLPLLHEIIVLIGLLANNSNELKESLHLSLNLRIPKHPPPSPPRNVVRQQRNNQRNKKAQMPKPKPSLVDPASMQYLEEPIPSLLSFLCKMPLNYFINPDESLVLIPTLVACCLDNPENTEYVKNNINGLFIVKFFQSYKEDPLNILSVQYRVPKNKVQSVIEIFSKK